MPQHRRFCQLQAQHRENSYKVNNVQVVAVNGMSEGVSVVPRDIALLERGRDVRALGVNIVVADFFDAGLAPFFVPDIGHTDRWARTQESLAQNPYDVAARCSTLNPAYRPYPSPLQPSTD